MVRITSKGHYVLNAQSCIAADKHSGSLAATP